MLDQPKSTSNISRCLYQLAKMTPQEMIKDKHLVHPCVQDLLNVKELLSVREEKYIRAINSLLSSIVYPID